MEGPKKGAARYTNFNIVTLTIIGSKECHLLHHGLLLFPCSYCTRQPKYDALIKSTVYWEEQGWRSGGNSRLPPMWPGFKSRRPRHMDAICGLSLLLVLSFAPRGFSPGTPVFTLFNNQHFQIPIRNETHGNVSTSSQELG